ncbi:tRNA N(3)-methylcytidine methyltransferase METTL2 [Ixodes scapularis]|uniref:tRNA N(3)-methylcytidine methyltransferase METTL2 n=1 Tax=Ixodes scapularis TaxID=6945 RepID=UPI001C395259|nr:tRNA N(3)-methylcytidine methyltransferase METTL2 [Ixodes scapularis]
MDEADKRPQFGQRYLDDKSKVFEHNAWDDVCWTEEQLEAAKQKVSENATEKVDAALREKYEADAAVYWDKFYSIHSNRFFKDRHWLFVEFPELLPENMPKGLPSEATSADASYPGSSATMRILEVGCGVGNTVFPILEVNRDPGLFVYSCDFSATAVSVLKDHQEYDPRRCHAFVCNVTQDWTVPFPEGSLDVITLIFVLSAISPERMQHVVNSAYQYLKPGGSVILRDYGRYDMAQLRFKRGRCLAENFYVRGDGTRVYFFTQEELTAMFEKRGFVEEMNHLDRRLQVNRGKLLQMFRVWIQARFRKPTAPS